ncbi:zinc finger c2h2-type integrase dna-binding protein [Diplodia corticola]|uniref:Zinc finger c2h2-type integrase dna-binding protein n=1 Tax=Diplodia corticola TaxID=236234 RepID=A0A1J9S6Z3_9PEZI|nr:zinc finger c2h2-type integrase dna-binding protein [Diplodia corticola]OJD35692.1 zinc finger c2h2-type integrase dna-binding protein [Diplodia corticola]
MVSYLDPSAHNTMSPNDFDLYPSQEESYGSVFAHSQYPAVTQPYHHFTSFDAQPNIHAFSAPQSSNMYAFKQNYLPYSPAASPASGSQSFEVCPPQLSTASESTASAQSTSPSAAGSPSMGQHFIEQPWSVLGHGLGLAPGLEASEPFTTCGFEYESMVAPDSKISGCVGESKLSSPSQASARTAFPFALRHVSTSDARRRSGAQAPRERAVGAASQQPVAPSLGRSSTPVKDEDVFKTPTTPASAMVSFPPSSAPLSYHSSGRSAAAAMSANRKRRSSLLSNQMRPSGAPAELSAGFVLAKASASPVSQVSASPQAASDASSFPMDSSCWFP